MSVNKGLNSVAQQWFYDVFSTVFRDNVAQQWLSTMTALNSDVLYGVEKLAVHLPIDFVCGVKANECVVAI